MESFIRGEPDLEGALYLAGQLVNLTGPGMMANRDTVKIINQLASEINLLLLEDEQDLGAVSVILLMTNIAMLITPTIMALEFSGSI